MKYVKTQILTKTLRQDCFLSSSQDHSEGESKYFSMKLSHTLLGKGLLSVCSRYFNLLFKPSHNNDISTDVCHNSSAHWQGWQKFRTRGNPLTWCASAQQLRTRAEWANECVAASSDSRGLVVVSWDWMRVRTVTTGWLLSIWRNENDISSENPSYVCAALLSVYTKKSIIL